ncbi:MAG: hypothetical protein V4729_03055 [Pseudomonadota bacterium]
MKLLVLLLVLGMRQTDPGRDLTLAISSQARRWRDAWLERAARDNWQGALGLGLVMLPALLLLAVVVALQEVPHPNLFIGLIGLVVMLVVLLDRAVPEALAREREAWSRADEESGELIAQADPALVEEAANAELARARRGLLGEQMRQLFAPLFWFLLLGPVAALFYYLLRLCAEGRVSATPALAARLLHFADWPVARVLGLSFALAGDFVATWQHWRERVLEADADATEFVDESAQAAQPVAVRMNAGELPGSQLIAGLAAVAALAQRALVIWIVLLALHTLWP